jgi:hypothetical protein
VNGAEHEIEPVRGLPDYLPEGETILWQGAPDWRALGPRMFRLKWVAAYFAALLGWRMIESGGDLSLVGRAMLMTPIMAAAAIGVLGFIAWLIARTTVYTITNKRLVIRSGVALPMIVNVPFKSVASAGLRGYDDGTGDLPLATFPDSRIAYLLLWPNARPRRFTHTEPMLRSVPDAAEVARILGRALAAAADQPVMAAEAPKSAGASLPAAAVA